jgi:hypothetical protein
MDWKPSPERKLFSAQAQIEMRMLEAVSPEAEEKRRMILRKFSQNTP